MLILRALTSPLLLLMPRVTKMVRFGEPEQLDSAAFVDRVFFFSLLLLCSFVTNMQLTGSFSNLSSLAKEEGQTSRERERKNDVKRASEWALERRGEEGTT